MNLKLVFAASLLAAFVSWYVCGLIADRATRGILRGAFVALLCSPGIVVGHGIGVVPSIVALYWQPSIFSLVPVLVVWAIAMGVIFWIPALRNHRNAWPPTADEIFLRAYVAKFIFFGIIAAVLMMALVFGNYPRAAWVEALQYVAFFGGALANLALCYRATRAKQANSFATPLLFAAPALPAASPIVFFMWYGGGAIGGLVGSGRRRVASWFSLSFLALLSAYALFRTYLAATAQPHVTIGGGVAGNAALAALFAVVAIVAWRGRN